MKLSVNQKVVGVLAISTVVPAALTALVSTVTMGVWMSPTIAMFAFCVYMSPDLVPVLFDVLDKGKTK